MINAIILAGEERSKKWQDVDNKALFPLNGKKMIDYVIEALKNIEGVKRIVVVGPRQQLISSLTNDGVEVLDSSGGIMENLRAGVVHLATGESLLVCSCDIPFITSEAINDFISQARDIKADLCYPIIEKSVNEKKFPEARRTYVKIREGTFTGGNIFYVNPEAVERGFDLADRLLKERKKPMKMAWILGPGFLCRLALGILSVDNIEKKVSKLLNIKAKAVISRYAEIGNDVDRPDDVAFAASYLTNKKD